MTEPEILFHAPSVTRLSRGRRARHARQSLYETWLEGQPKTPEDQLMAAVTRDMKLTAERARAAAHRLLAARDPMLPKPKTEGELMDLVDYMAKASRRHGVFLTGTDKKALKTWHTYLRARLHRATPA